MRIEFDDAKAKASIDKGVVILRMMADTIKTVGSVRTEVLLNIMGKMGVNKAMFEEFVGILIRLCIIADSEGTLTYIDNKPF